MIPAYLDHIGIAIRSDSRLALALRVLGLPITGQERVEREKVDTQWVPLPVQQGNIELLLPTDPESTIAKFLDKNSRDGIHHLSFRVQNISEATEALVKEGFQMIYPNAKPGAHNCLVNFIHPKTTGGVLLEITEKQK